MFEKQLANHSPGQALDKSSFLKLAIYPITADGKIKSRYKMSRSKISPLILVVEDEEPLAELLGQHDLREQHAEPPRRGERAAHAARARQELPSSDPEAEVHFFLGVAFPDVKTRILPYNRTVADLADQTPDAFLDLLRSQFPVKRSDTSVPPKGSVAMYLQGQWWSIDFGLVRERMALGSPVSKLDVAMLQDCVMAPLLGIADIRTDPRVTFVGGGRGTDALVQSVDSGEAAVAFSLAAVTPTELLDISDADEMMPPKSTWFEPKLRDGLLIHPLQP